LTPVIGHVTRRMRSDRSGEGNMIRFLSGNSRFCACAVKIVL